MFQGLTLELVTEAVEMVKPTIIHLFRSDKTGGRHNLYLVVRLVGQRSGEFLYEGNFGEDPSEWKYDFRKIARAKAFQCMRTGMVGRTLLRDAPWLVESGDTRYAGGVVENGLVVAASGVQDYFDEMISWMVLSAIQGLCRDEISKIQDDDPDFFGR